MRATTDPAASLEDLLVNNRYAALAVVAMTIMAPFASPSAASLAADAPTATTAQAVRFTPPPPAGEHPRIYLTTTDLPALRERIKSGGARDGYNNCVAALKSFTDPQSPPSQVLAKAAANPSSLSANERGALLSALDLASLVPLVTEKAADAEPLTAALMAYVRNAPIVKGSVENGVDGVGPAYDLLYRWLTPDQRAEVRSWIAAAAIESEKYLDKVVYGFAPPSEARTYNWIPIYVGKFAMGALAIEGEPGYEPRWYTKSVASLKDFLDYGISSDGCAEESIHYFSYGMHGGAYLLDAAERRGAKLLEHPKLTQVPLWWSYDLFPWTMDFNETQDTTDQTMGVGEIYQLLHAAHPDDPRTRWIHATHVAFDGCDTLNKIGRVLWSTEPDTTIKPSDFNLPPSHYFAESGIAYLRSDWGKEATYLEIQSDPVGAGPSHMHPDRNAFTFAGNGTLWAMDTGFGFPFDFGHNEVLVDGKGQGFFPMRGKPLQYRDGVWATGFMGDAKEAYDYRSDWDSVAGGTKVDGLNAFSYNPVQRAYRSAVLVRGAHPYAMIVDDLRKDDLPHDYQWHMLTPLGNALGDTKGGIATLRAAYEGPYLRGGAAPGVKMSFDIPTAGKYRVWLLYGKPYTDPWNWWPEVVVDKGKAVQVTGKTSANAHIHWQPAQDPMDLAAGSHTLIVRTRLGTCNFVAAIVAPEGFDGLSAEPVMMNAPNGGAYMSLLDAPLPKGWTVEHDDHPARLLMRILATSEPKITASVMQRIRPDNKADKGPVLQVNANVQTIDPKFRVMLYSYRVGDPEPAIVSKGDTATVTWPDGTVDKWLFGTAAGAKAHNGSAVKVTRTVGRKSETFDLLGPLKGATPK
ncbi:MAG TPA: hypothetical protein VGK19_00285 [Capsulimonadaceae bacterium]|jgi:hypothetical protein